METKSKKEFVTRNLSDIPIEDTEWFWKPKLIGSSLNLFGGTAGVAKTGVIIDVMARYTTGANWPDGSPNATPKGRVLILNAEDHKAQTIHPRFIAASGAPNSVTVVEGTVLPENADKKTRAVAILDDMDALEAELDKDPTIGLVVIDPISNYLGKKRMNNSQEVREVLTPLRDLAERRHICILCNSHFNKTKKGDSTALGRFSGASAFHEVPRAVWAFVPDTDSGKNHFKMLWAKVNNSGDKSGIRYHTEGVEVTHNGVTAKDVLRIVWDNTVDETAEEELQAQGVDEDPTEIDKALTFLRRTVTRELPVAVVEAAAASQNISKATLKRAKQDGGFVSYQKRGGGWVMNLPKLTTFPTHKAENDPPTDLYGGSLAQE